MMRFRKCLMVLGLGLAAPFVVAPTLADDKPNVPVAGSKSKGDASKDEHGRTRAEKVKAEQPPQGDAMKAEPGKTSAERESATGSKESKVKEKAKATKSKEKAKTEKARD